MDNSEKELQKSTKPRRFGGTHDMEQARFHVFIATVVTRIRTFGI